MEETLKDRYDAVCRAYIARFVSRHGLPAMTAQLVSDGIGELLYVQRAAAEEAVSAEACAADDERSVYKVKMTDVRHDVDTEQPVGMFERWYAAVCDAECAPAICYMAYTRGMTPERYAALVDGVERRSA